MRRVTVLMVVVALVGACSGTSDSAGTTTSLPPETSTSAVEQPSTTPSTQPPREWAEGLSYFRFGADGLFRVEDDTMTQLVDEPVWWALDDLMGGVLFRYGPPPGTDAYPPIELRPGVYWLREGQATPEQYPHEHDYWEPWFTGVVDGRATVFFGGILQDADKDSWDCADWALVGHDLLDGYEREHVCLPIGDGGFGIGSTGGNVFVGDTWVAVGVMSTSHDIGAWDVRGDRIELFGNPYDSSCAPCSLSALISLDGRYLAYSSWPEAPWSASPDAWIQSEKEWDDWWESARSTPVRIGVVDLESGREVWRTDRPAGTHLFDFDGRHLVLHEVIPDPTYGESELRQTAIVDTWGLHDPVVLDPEQGLVLIHPPSVMPGREGPFWTIIVSSLDTALYDLGAALDQVDAMETETGLRPSVLRSDDFVSLNPGYWVLYDGVYETEEEAVANADAARDQVGSGYVRWVATQDAMPPAPVTVGSSFPSAGSRNEIPWAEVDGDWVLALYQGIEAEVLYLVSPDGVRYEAYSWPPESRPIQRITDWSPDHRQALFLRTNSRPVPSLELVLLDLATGQTSVIESSALNTNPHLWGRFTRPTGRNLMVYERSGAGTEASLERRTPSGQVLATFVPPGYWLYLPNGEEVLIGDDAGLRLHSNDGTLRDEPTAEPYPGHGVHPLRWWADDVVLLWVRSFGDPNARGHASFGENRLVLLELDSGATSQLAYAGDFTEMLGAWDIDGRVVTQTGESYRDTVHQPQISGGWGISFEGSLGRDRVVGTVDERLIVLSMPSTRRGGFLATYSIEHAPGRPASLEQTLIPRIGDAEGVLEVAYADIVTTNRVGAWGVLPPA